MEKEKKVEQPNPIINRLISSMYKTGPLKILVNPIEMVESYWTEFHKPSHGETK